MRTPRRAPAQRGFTILEALIALLVMAFGILALAGMQIMLSNNADIARQRSEATRLAQERIERMRAYDGIGTGTITWNALPVATETFSANTNTTYTVAGSVGGAATDAMRSVSVTASWTDRTGAAQQVVLNSVISQTDPATIGDLGNPLPLNQAIKRVKNRNINIPIPAIDLGGGKSATQFDPNFIIVYSNTTGGVVTICNPLLGLPGATAAQINGLLADLLGSCQSVRGYIVAGYVSRSGTSNVPNSVFDALGINYGLVTRTDAHPSFNIRCQFGNAVDQNNPSVTIPNFKYYLCVVPLADPAAPDVPNWDGTIRIGGVNTTSNYVICRYQYTQTNIDNNERNIQPYSNVDKSIDEQNYWIASSTNANYCATTSDGALNLTGVSQGVEHQNCRSSNTGRAAACPASS